MKPKIYVTRHLPEQALNALLETCDVEIWDKEFPPPYEVLSEKIVDKEGLMCLLTDHIDAELINAAPDLKVISQIAVGFDNIDIEAATARGIAVGNTPGVLTDATADFAWTLLMAAARRVGEGIEYVKAGQWNTWGLTLFLGADVYGATLGVIGMGRIGQAIAKRAQGFDMKILYYDIHRQLEAEESYGIEYRELDDLLQESDFVTLHVNLTDETRGMINARSLGLMKPTAILINTARGPIVNPDALYDALVNDEIAYAALDVTDPEPIAVDDKLLSLPNCIIVPHIASATLTTRTEMAMIAVRNLLSGLKGEPLPCQVNKL